MCLPDKFLAFFAPFPSLLASIATANLASADIIPDATLPYNSTVTPNGSNFTIDSGTTAGTNLFHSFKEFSLPTNSEAFFNNPTSIDNIITRVTGSSLSTIDGLIRANGTANLFLVNPNGIIFGPNAHLDIGGSFFASTADGIRLGEQGLFSATNPETSNLLTVQPSALFVNAMAAQTAKLNNQGNLAVETGSSLTLHGGEVSNTGNLTAPGGTVAILGEKVGLFEDAQIDVSSPTGGGNIFVGGYFQGRGNIPTADRTYIGTNVTLKADGLNAENGGNVVVWGNEITGFYGDISARGGGFVEVSAGNHLIFRGNVDTTITSGSAGTLLLDPRNITIANGEPSLEVEDADRIAFDIFNGERSELNSTADVTIYETQLEGLSGDTNVLLQATNNITVEDLEDDSLNLARGTGDITFIADADRDGVGDFSMQDQADTINTNGRDIAITGASLTLGNIDTSVPALSGAGDLLKTAAIISTGQGEPVETISGNLSSSSDVDLYQVYLTGEGTFSATTVDGSNLDTQLFLFDGEGFGVYGNDDNSACNCVQSTLLADDPLTPTAPGIYYLGITQFGVSPISESGEIYSGGVESILEPTGAGGDLPLAGWEGSESLLGDYIITLTGVEGASATFVEEIDRTDSGAITLTATQGTLTTGDLIAVSSGGRGGDILLEAAGEIVLNGSTVDSSGVVGGAGEIKLTAGSLSLTNSYIDARTFGVIVLNGSSVDSSRVVGGARGIELTAGSLSLTNSDIDARTFGEEDGRGIELTAGTLFLTDSNLSTTTRGEGDGGRIELTAGTLFLTDSDIDATTEGEGDGGRIELTAGTLSVTNSVIRVDTSGEGDAGGIELTAGSLSITSSSFLDATTSGEGDAGGIELTAGSLFLTDSRLNASTFGKGNAGGIELTASNLSLTDSSFVDTSTSDEGNAGGIELTASNLSLTNSRLFTRTLGEGDGGDFIIDASEAIHISGVNSSGQSSGLFATAESEAIGEAGDIIISTPSLNLSAGAAISTRTSSDFRGGDIEISTNSLSVTEGAQILSSSLSSGNAGTIKIDATEQVTISGTDPSFNSRLAESGESPLDTISEESAILSNATETGNAGSVNLTTDQLQVNSGAQISVDSAEGVAGSLNITADTIDLNNGTFNAETAAGEEGNINLTASDIRLFDNSDITTNAQNDSTGGNITINTDTLVLEESKITAQAVAGQGGNIQINTQGFFPDSLSSIDASSDLGIDGTVEINNQLEPTQGLVELSAAVIDASDQVTEGCAAYADSSFIITGSGGLPPSPTGLLRGRALWLDERFTSSANQPVLIEATGWITHANGQVELVSQHPVNDKILGSTLNAQASILLKQGKTQAALETWQQAAEAYQLAGDKLGVLGAIINQGQALQSLGLYRGAQRLLEGVNQFLANQPDREIKAIALQSLGVTLQAVGELEKSTEILQQSLAISQQLGRDSLVSGTLLSLGNVASAKSEPKAAIKFYQQAADRATTHLEKTEALLNLLAVYVQEERGDEVLGLLAEIEAEIGKIPVSRDGVYARVNLAGSLMAANMATDGGTDGVADGVTDGGTDGVAGLRDGVVGKVGDLLRDAVVQSRELEDKRGEAIALHHLASLYQKVGQLTAAQTLTEKSLLIAEGIKAEELVARSQSQLGQILKQQGKLDESIIAYSQAVKGFESLRKDLVVISEDAQFDFRETVEPTYRKLVSLLLRDNPSQTQLKQAIDLIEALQLAELDNFFQDTCLEAQPEQIDRIDATAAVIYPIILPESLEIIFLQQNRPIRHHQIKLSQTEVEKAIRAMRNSMRITAFDEEQHAAAGKLYTWLIEPFEEQLADRQIETLVFILDGNFRNVPMAALYDRQKEEYLVEKYAIALTPGRQLLKSPSLEPERIQAFTGGVSESVQGFSALPAVELELRRISELIPSQNLLNQEFTRENLETKTAENTAPIVHLATHGQFSSNRDETFILAWDEKVNVTEFERILRQRENPEAPTLELLVLSACQTASGDNRAALGLAGLAVRSGARSTLATLWSVQDRSTAQLIVEFYQQLKDPQISKAEALRRAQLSLLKGRYKPPYFWAPFVLVGNWQ